MEPVTRPTMSGSFRGESPDRQLSRLFGSYRAEALRDELYELFSEPAYFRDLTTQHSCILQGGRGTGKTTVLRSLSYLGQASMNPGISPESLPHIGLYYRVNPNRTAAFRGEELSIDAWTKHFAHYFNLIVVLEVLQFLRWFNHGAIRPIRAPEEVWRNTSAALNLRECQGLEGLFSEVELALHRFEAYINNVGDRSGPELSLQGAPIDVLISGLRATGPLQQKNFFILVDEYEKLEDYQQVVVNTLIKQSGEHYCFKVGVRELGLRTRETLSPNEHLVSPADFSLIDVDAELDAERFRSFASDVCNQRLARLSPGDDTILRSVEDLFPGLSEEDEAARLGVAPASERVLARIAERDPALSSELAKRSAFEIYFVEYWSRGSGRDVIDLARECVDQSQEWRNRFGNYRYASLFTIKRGKRGIRKYYCGWRTFTLLAAGNIRYLLQLVDRSLSGHLAAGNSLADPVSPDDQTRVAQEIGLKALTDLSGLSVHGAQVTKLQLGLGRLFGQFAADPVGHTPEVNQFSISRSDELEPEDRSVLSDVIRASVMDLALRSAPGTKPTDAGETREPEYWPHPIFSAYFVFSHRQKRKMTLSELELLGLLRQPRRTINSILERTDRPPIKADDDMPEQLEFFEAYYRGAE